MDAVEILGYLALALLLAAFAMRAVTAVRAVAMLASLGFIAYGLLAPSYPIALAHAAILAVNVWRFVEMRQLVAAARSASGVPLNVDWLLPYMRPMTLPADQVVFRRGDVADAIYFVADGRLRLEESGLELGKGALFGEIGIFSDNHRRTATVRSVAPTSLLMISAQRVRELYYQNPRFGFYLVGLITQRLMQNADIEAGAEAVAGGEHAPTPRSG